MGVACLTRPNHVFLYAHRLSFRWRLHAIARESAIYEDLSTALTMLKRKKIVFRGAHE